MKARINLSIDVSVLEKFKEKTNNISAWVEQKMKEELSKEDSVFLLAPLHNNLNKFWLGVLLHYSPLRVNTSELKQKIGAYFGMDQRTIRKYYDLLKDYDYIRESKQHLQIVFIRPEYGWIRMELEEEEIHKKETEAVLKAKPEGVENDKKRSSRKSKRVRSK